MSGRRKAAVGRIGHTTTLLALGFFPVAAQTLLFRTYLGTFEGNELGIGCFFGSWLLWVAMGAWVARIDTRFRPVLQRSFEWFPLLYLPAYLFQYGLITHARVFAGFESYDVLPIRSLVVLSFLCSGPVCFLTGYFFASACGWMSGKHGLPVARVYIFETLGGFTGGVAVTVLLACAMPAQSVALAAGAVVAASVAVSRPSALRNWAPLAILLVMLISGAGTRWTQFDHRSVWSRLLPEKAYQGSFATGQAEYLYGERNDQFLVMTCGGVREALPDTDHASAIAAIHLAQQPSATRILVVGPDSLALCLRLASFPQVQRIVWIDPDRDYPRRILAVLPDRYRAAAGKVELPREDARQFLAHNPAAFDLAILNLPDPTGLVVNRYATREFLVDTSKALVRDGVASVRISGGRNYLGSELAFLGASLLTTVESVFHHVVVKPGEETWLIASNGPTLSDAPAVLRDRYAGIPGAAPLYPPEGLLSQYVPDRMAFQMQIYRGVAASVPKRLLLNLDNHPKALLYGLMLARRRTGEQMSSFQLPLLLESAFWMAAIAVVVFVGVRLVYVLKSSRPERGAAPWPFDAGFLVFSTGLAGMSLSMIVMLLYQSQFGTLFLNVGLITSLFMFGSFVGSLVGERLVLPRASEPRALLAVLIVLQLALFATVAVLPLLGWRAIFAILFVLAGGFTGVYFPFAAKRMSAANRAPTPSGSSLEALDTVGGAFGAVITGLGLMPVLGSHGALGLLALLVATNLPLVFVQQRRAYREENTDRFEQLSRVLGYTMFGVAVFLLAASHIGATVAAEAEGPRFDAAARVLTGRTNLEKTERRLANGKSVPFIDVPATSDDGGGYVFTTGLLNKPIPGYGGPIELAIYVDRQGALRNFVFLRSNETPAYVARLGPWTEELVGKNLFGAKPFARIDAMSGATITSSALLRALEQAGHRFASDVLHLKVDAATSAPPRTTLDRGFAALVLFAVGALIMRYFPGTKRRRLFLFLVVVTMGWWLNVQYSMQHAIALLDLNWPLMAASASFAVVVLVPLAVALFGNFYCGYLCPFGALQELIGDLRPSSWHSDPNKESWRYGRYTKYVLLFLLVALFARYRDMTVLSADPLITVFGTARSLAIVVLAVTVMVACFFYRRFWCRNLCPAGAFLALVGGLNLLKRILPKVQPSKCDMGVRTGVELDCLRCDRCKHE